MSSGLAVAIQQRCFDQGGQPIHRGLIGLGTGTLHEGFQLTETTQLIEPPGLATITKG